MNFGEALRKKLDEKGMRPAELARRSGTTKQNISRILNNVPHGITGAPPKVEEATVEKFAKALDWDLDEARVAAGFAPLHPTFARPKNFEELARILEVLGIELQAIGGLENRDEEFFNDLLDDLAQFLQFRLTHRPPRVRELHFEDDTQSSDNNSTGNPSRRFG